MTEKSRSNQKTVAILMSIVLIAALVLSFSLFLQKNTLQQNVDKLTTDLKASGDSVTALTDEKAGLEDTLKTTQASADDAAARLTALQAELDAAKADVTAKQAELDNAAKDKETATTEKTTLTDELAAAKKAADDLNAKVAALETEKQTLTAKLDDANKQITDLNAKIAKLEADNKALKATPTPKPTAAPTATPKPTAAPTSTPKPTPKV
jgi:chromosome segregation ATPase